MAGKYSAEKLLLRMLELDPVEFLGVCKILGVDIYDINADTEKKIEVNDVECGPADVIAQPKEFYELWSDICDIVGNMNRKRRRNLGNLIYNATKKEK